MLRNSSHKHFEACHVSQRNERYALVEVFAQITRSLNGQASFAHSARPGDGNQWYAVIAKQRQKRSEFLGPAKKRRSGVWQRERAAAEIDCPLDHFSHIMLPRATGT